MGLRELDQKASEWLMKSLKKEGKIEFKLTVEWQTPDEYLEAARELMGGIDIDPASSDRSQERIKAKVYYTKATNGLDKPWYGRMWANPPYDTGVLEKFCDRAIEQYKLGNVTEGLLMTNTNNTHHEHFQKLLGGCSGICFVKDWVRWVPSFDREQQMLANIGIDWHAEYTKHGNAVFYFGPKVDEFKRIFSKFGVCYGK